MTSGFLNPRGSSEVPVTTAPDSAGQVIIWLPSGGNAMATLANLFAGAATKIGIRTSSPLSPLHVFHASTIPAGELGSIIITGASTLERLCMGYETTVGAWIQSVLNGTAPTPLRLNPNGGGLLCAVHNVAAGAGATQAISGGTYGPTGTAVTNVASTANRSGLWGRVGHTVFGVIYSDIDPSVAGIKTSVGFSLPVASDFTAASQLGGSAINDTGAAMNVGQVFADATTNRLQLDYYADAGGGNQTWKIQFVYTVS